MGGANKQESYCAVQGLRDFRRVQSVTQALGCACMDGANAPSA